eukprot:scaffold24863_cov112-Isochrysis_galbana.AAC.6
MAWGRHPRVVRSRACGRRTDRGVCVRGCCALRTSVPVVCGMRLRRPHLFKNSGDNQNLQRNISYATHIPARVLVQCEVLHAYDDDGGWGGAGAQALAGRGVSEVEGVRAGPSVGSGAVAVGPSESPRR